MKHSLLPSGLAPLMALAAACLGLGRTACADDALERKEAGVIASVEKIWDEGEHNAFTDLIRFSDKWFCTFREADSHAGGTDGAIRVIESEDGAEWASVALLKEDGVDLRDPKFSVTPEGKLMIVAGGSVYDGKELTGRRPRVTLSDDGHTWTPTQRVLSEGEWLWRVTWHKGRAYGTTYNIHSGPEEAWRVRLMASDDGVHFEEVVEFPITDRPNETTLRVLPDDRMVALVRREKGNCCCWIGVSNPPYTDWEWHETEHRIGGPNFIVLPDGSMWAGGRSYPGGAKCVLARFGTQTYEPILTLPSGGDCSYPGFVWHDDMLWMSYYSSHEGKTSIYLAKIRLSP